MKTTAFLETFSWNELWTMAKCIKREQERIRKEIAFFKIKVKKEEAEDNIRTGIIKNLNEDLELMQKIINKLNNLA